MEIKEGMYARIDNDFRTICLGIGKIKKIVEDTVYVETTKDRFNGIPISYNKNQIEKASYNLIDLIEVGDYVNNELIIDKFYDYANKEWNLVTSSTKYLKYDKYRKDIKTIVTKEQFNSMKYEVGE